MSVPFSLWLRENPKGGSSDIRNLTDMFVSWRHCIRSVGGNWQAEGTMMGHPPDMERFFVNNIGKRIVAKTGGRDMWEGQIVRMEHTTAGQKFVRTIEEQNTYVKVIYTRVGDNLLDNGDVESGSWAAFGTPATLASTTEWFAKGTTSMCCVTDAAAEGAVAASAVAIDASKPYECSMVVSVGSGLWTLTVQDETTSTLITSRATTACGRRDLECHIPDDNAYTSVDINITGDAGGAEAYFDAAMLRIAPVKSETQWHVDESGASAFGRIEALHLEREMSDGEADDFARKELAERAWPRSKPARRGSTFPGEKAPPDSLVVTCQGMVWTLKWKHSLSDGTAEASAHLSALLDETEFLAGSLASFDANAASEVFLESRYPKPIWREIEKVIRVGDGSSAWMGGVYPGFEFRHEPRPASTTQYQFHAGSMFYYGGGWLPPLEFTPGWCRMMDMPTAPPPAGGGVDDDPKRVWLDETWFIYENGQVRLEWAYDEEEED